MLVTLSRRLIMNQTTMSHIFLLILSERDCCSNHETTIRAFSEKHEAECYMEDMRHRISFNAGLEEAVMRIMETGWEKSHPEPIAPSDDEWNTPAYNEYRQAQDAYYEARRVETDRLLALVGYDKTVPYYRHHDSHLFLREVPFGLEVAKPATEEPMAQAAE
jgi:hypothetical protein